MYNNDLKLLFIRSTTKNINTAVSHQTVFNKLQPYEEKLAKDVCQMTTDELQLAVEEVMTCVKQASAEQYLIFLRNYAKWCVENNVDGATLNVFEIKDFGLNAVKKNMIANPLQLQLWLDKFLDKESLETSDNVYRAFYWLAFIGVPNEFVFDVKYTDVDLDYMVVRINGCEYSICSEAIRSLRNCATMSSFAYNNPNYRNSGTIRRDRTQSVQLLRGVKSELTRTSISSFIRRKAESAKIDHILLYNDIWLSGRFYEVYQREMIGLDADFRPLATAFIGRKTRKVGCNGKKQEWRVAEVSKNYETDYIRWKLAFNL